LWRGDLVFYAKSGSTPSHVAIVVGRREGRPMVVSHGSESGPLYLPWDYRRVVQARRYITTAI
jgi:cell wall-associated NlpC family hydrolase